MKRFLTIFVSIIAFTACSFDDKTGLWKDATKITLENGNSRSIENNNSNIRYENIFIREKTFYEEKETSNLYNFEIDTPVRLSNWHEQYAVSTNNISNFSYSGNKTLLFKSRKLNKFSFNKNNLKKNIVFYENNLISHDSKGTIFIYSLNQNKKIFEYNFYKKNFKNFDKEIYFIVNENVLYAADNLGYLYALNLDDSSIIWAKNYGIPFRSNLKFAKNQIFLANQDNVIYSINPNTGIKNWQFATSLTFLKSDFKNNFALDSINDLLFFLNASGELYSINYLTQKINWILNFKKRSLVGDTELFLGQPIVIKNNNLVISTDKSVLSYDTLTAEKKWDLTAEPIIKPIITLSHTYVLLKNNLLVCLDNLTGNVVWSKNIFKNTEEKKIKKKFESIIDFKIVNGEINIYSKNGYLLSFKQNDGSLNYLNRISKNGINSEIFFLNDDMFFLDSDNRVLLFN